MRLLADLLEELPRELTRQVFTHASWSERRSESYARLAFLGDSVLALAVTAHLYPRLEAERFGAGRLTKIRAQAVSGVSCREVAERLALRERLRAAAPAGATESATAVVDTERVLASVIEAVIGACYLHAGY
jgi:ribonuclease-3